MWTPADLSPAPSVWLDGTDLATMTVVDGRVASWVSKDPTGRVFTTTHSVNQRPHLDPDGVRFENPDGIVVSTANTQCLVTPMTTGDTGPVSIYAVASHRHATHDGPIVAMSVSIESSTTYSSLSANNVSSRCGGDSNVAGYADYAHWPQNTPGLLRGVFASASTRRFQFNRAEDISNHSSCSVPFGYHLLGVSRVPNGFFPASGLRGTIHELILVRALLSPEQEALLEEYLLFRHLWGIDSVVWTRIAGRALTSFSAPADRVRIVDAQRVGVAAVVRTNRLGEWEREGWIPREYLVIHESLGCAPVVHGPYTATAS